MVDTENYPKQGKKQCTAVTSGIAGSEAVVMAVEKPYVEAVVVADNDGEGRDSDCVNDNVVGNELNVEDDDLEDSTELNKKND